VKGYVSNFIYAFISHDPYFRIRSVSYNNTEVSLILLIVYLIVLLRSVSYEKAYIYYYTGIVGHTVGTVRNTDLYP
jgi:hypothetical protein